MLSTAVSKCLDVSLILLHYTKSILSFSVSVPSEFLSHDPSRCGPSLCEPVSLSGSAVVALFLLAISSDTFKVTDFSSQLANFMASLPSAPLPKSARLHFFFSIHFTIAS